jgi:hypothetical protein
MAPGELEIVWESGMGPASKAPEYMPSHPQGSIFA